MKTKSISESWDALRRQIEGRPTISRIEITELAAHHLDMGTDYVIRRLCREGYLKRAKIPSRGLYLVTTGTMVFNHILRNPLNAIQAQYGTDMLFCYGSALYLHGLSRYGRLSDYYVAASEAKKQSTVGQVRVHFVKTPVDTTVGTTTIEVSDGHVEVTDIERTLIDCIHRPKYAQGWENIVHAIGRMGKLKEDRLFEYLKRYRLPSLVAKTCVILDRFSDDLGVDADALARLRPYLPRNPIRFSRNEPGIFNKRWNVYVPQYLIQK